MPDLPRTTLRRANLRRLDLLGVLLLLAGLFLLLAGSRPAALPQELTRLGEPGQASHYRFRNVDDTGRPARWDRCAPIGYRINTSGAPADAVTTVKEAMRRAGAASGLTFRYQGTTTVVPFVKASWEDTPLPAGTHIVFAWAPERATSLLSGSTVGVGNSYIAPASASVERDLGRQIVRGGVLLEAGSRPGGFDGERSTGAVLLHEVGHVLNLDHVTDRSQLMSGKLHDDTPADYQDGDRAGLAALRTSRCFPTS